MSAAIKIALVDDEVLFRKGISFLLQREDNIDIIFEASNGEELLLNLDNSVIKPDIIIMDLKMPILKSQSLLPPLESQRVKLRRDCCLYHRAFFIL